MTVKEPPEITCNLCGELCNLGQWKTPHGLIESCVSGGYESTAGNGYGALDDGDSYHFSLCEFCLDWLFSRFKIPPTVYEFCGNGEPNQWSPAKDRVVQDEWRRMTKLFFAEKERRDKAREHDNV